MLILIEKNAITEIKKLDHKSNSNMSSSKYKPQFKSSNTEYKLANVVTLNLK